MKYYSPTTFGFYDDKIPADIPADAVELTAAEYVVLMDAMSDGRGIVMRDDGVPMPGKIPIDAVRSRRATDLENDLHRYIFRMHGYPVPTQMTLQALYADPDTPEACRAACRSVFGWIKGTVLPYYYERKAAIMAVDDPGTVSWDFAGQCDASAPGVTLAGALALQ